MNRSDEETNKQKATKKRLFSGFDFWLTRKLIRVINWDVAFNDYLLDTLMQDIYNASMVGKSYYVYEKATNMIPIFGFHAYMEGVDHLIAKLIYEQVIEPVDYTDDKKVHTVKCTTKGYEIMTAGAWSDERRRKKRVARNEKLRKSWSGLLAVASVAIAGYAAYQQSVDNKEAQVQTNKINARIDSLIRLRKIANKDTILRIALPVTKSRSDDSTKTRNKHLKSAGDTVLKNETNR